MSIRYKWDDDQVILHITVEYPWTWAEYLETSATIKSLIDAADRPCATIVDTTHYGSLPRDGTTIQALLKIDALISHNVFATALVGAPDGVIVFFNMMMKLRPRLKRISLFTDTVDEAREKILERYHHMQSGTSDFPS